MKNSIFLLNIWYDIKGRFRNHENSSDVKLHKVVHQHN